MIKISSLNKYYNYKKSNQIQANKEITIELNDKGFVLVTGDSGSGKTTLLNCIAGIDTFEQGVITIDNKDYSANDISKLDEYRRNNIGIIFQDYKLIEDMTVEENIIFALKVSSKNVDYQIIDDNLAQVGMDGYNARKVNTLSGGQKQRIAIARALIVQPKVILADEPTGNLDKDNSIGIINLLKQISKKYLVLVVSHNEELMYPLADRIIRINDGIIVEDINKESIDELFFDKKALVYTEDYNQIVLPNNTFTNIFYKKNSINNIEIYLDNNKIYIKCIDKYEISNITNDEIKESKITNIGNDNKVILKEKELFNNTITRKYKSNNLLKNVFTFSKWKINAIICLIFTSLFIAISMGILSNTEIKPISYQKSANNLVMLEYFEANYKLEDFLTFEQEEDSILSYIPYIDDTKITLINESLPQFYNSENYNSFSTEYTTLYNISDKDVIIGKYPEYSDEILIDKMYIDFLFKNYSETMTANSTIDNYSAFINLSLFFDNTFDNFSKLKIVGIVDKGAPVLYIDINKIYSLFSEKLGDGQQILTELNTDMYTSPIVFKNEYEIYINSNTYNQLGYNEGNNEPFKCLGKNFTVVGSFTPNEKNTDDTYIIPSETLIKLVLENYIQRYNTIHILTNNKPQTLEYFNDPYNYIAQRAVVYDPIIKQYNSYLKEQQRTIGTQNTMTAAIILIAFIIIFFYTQSELSRNLSSIIVSRLLGESKRKLVLRVFKENIVFLIMIIIPLYIFFSVFINYIASIGIITIISNINYLYWFIGLLLQLFISVVASIIPIMRIANKTPIKLFTSNA